MCQDRNTVVVNTTRRSFIRLQKIKHCPAGLIVC